MAPRPPLDRLATRARPEDWGQDELVTLAEAAALFFPSGPLNASSLRVARRRGELACVELCGRTYTTPRSIRAMSEPRRESRSTGPEDDRTRVGEELRRRLEKR